jgi:hypothetical protein
VVLVSSWRARAFVLSVLVGCTILGIGASAGAAALPDARAWELVSPTNKLGNDIAADSMRTQVSVRESPGSPAAASFISLGGFSDVHGTSLATEYLAQRNGAPGTSGWVTHGITPRQDPLSLFAIPAGFEPGYRAFADDLSKGVFRSWSPLTDAPNVAHVPNLYVREDLRTAGEGFYQLVTNAPTLLPTPTIFGPNQPKFPFFADRTPDMQHLVFESQQNLTADARGTAIKLYKAEGGTTRLIAANPNCGATVGQCSQVGATSLHYVRRVLSADGRRVTFSNGPGSRLFQLDDRGTSTTNDDGLVQITTSENSTPQVTAPARFEIASVDGSRVFFSSDEQLTDGGGSGLYLWARQDTNQTQQIAVNATGGTYALTFHSQITHGTGDLTNGSNSITSANGPFVVGQTVKAPGIPAGTRIVAISGNTLTLSNNATTDATTQRLDASLDSSTGPVPAAASAAQIQDALAALDGIGAGNVTVTSPSAGTYNVTFTDALAGVNLAQLTPETTNLTGTATTTITTPIHNLTLVVTVPAADTGAIGASNDGHHLYFASLAGLVGGQPVGERAIYYWQDADGTPGGTLSVVGPTVSADLGAVTNFETWKFVPKVSRVSPDGRTVLFELVDGTGLPPRYDGHTCAINNNPNNSGNGCSQVFVYRADHSTPQRPDIVCASCPPRRVPPTESATINTRTGSSISYLTPHISHALSDDGRFVFFNSTDALVPEDTNGKWDAYEYDTATGRTSLLSTGKDPNDSYFMDASASGHDVYVVTRQRLVGWDSDTAYDLYDARVNGGFPEPTPATRECTGAACHGPTTPRSPSTPLASTHFKGLGNETPAKPAPRPTRCKRGKIKRRIHGRTRCIKRKHHRRRHHTRKHTRR